MTILNRRNFLSLGSILLIKPALVAPQLIAALNEFETQTEGRIGVYAKNLVTGDCLAWRETERFLMCSTFKASLVALVLLHIDQGKEELENFVPYTQEGLGEAYAPVARAHAAAGGMSVRSLCQGAIEQSDNVCANLLLARVGGPMALTRFWRSLGDRVTRLDDLEPVLNSTPLAEGRNTTTPATMAGSLEKILFSKLLTDTSRTLLTEWLQQCRTGIKRLRLGLPQNWSVGDKTGTNGKDIAADIAVVWPVPTMPLIMSVYTRAGHPTEQQFQSVFSNIGRLVRHQLVDNKI